MCKRKKKNQNSIFFTTNRENKYFGIQNLGKYYKCPIVEQKNITVMNVIDAIDITNVKAIINDIVAKAHVVVEVVVLKNVHPTVTMIVNVAKVLKNANARPKHIINVKKNTVIVHPIKYAKKRKNMICVIKLNCSKMVYSMPKMRIYFL